MCVRVKDHTSYYLISILDAAQDNKLIQIKWNFGLTIVL